MTFESTSPLRRTYSPGRDSIPISIARPLAARCSSPRDNFTKTPLLRFLELDGAGWTAANGRAARIADLLVGLLVPARALTPGALRRRAVGTAEDPGPSWAKCLRRPIPSEEEAKARWLARYREEVELTALPEEVWAQRQVPPEQGLLAHGHRGRGDAAPQGDGRGPPPERAAGRGAGRGSGRGCLSGAERSRSRSLRKHRLGGGSAHQCWTRVLSSRPPAACPELAVG